MTTTNGNESLAQKIQRESAERIKVIDQELLAKADFVKQAQAHIRDLKAEREELVPHAKTRKSTPAAALAGHSPLQHDPKAEYVDDTIRS